jgi:hypothetical protein
LVQSLRSDAEHRRIRPDFVERQEAVVDVERRVFDAFGGNRACDLLELPDEPLALFVLLWRARSALVQQDALDEVEDQVAQPGRPAAGRSNRPGGKFWKVLGGVF